MPAQKLLAATNTVEVVYLTPTSIGERLGIRARTVNAALIRMGLQFKNMNSAKGKPSYLPTEEGKPYSMMTVASGSKGMQPPINISSGRSGCWSCLMEVWFRNNDYTHRLRIAYRNSQSLKSAALLSKGLACNFLIRVLHLPS